MREVNAYVIDTSPIINQGLILEQLECQVFNYRVEVPEVSYNFVVKFNQPIYILKNTQLIINIILFYNDIIQSIILILFEISNKFTIDYKFHSYFV